MQVQRAVETVAAAHLHHLGAESREKAKLVHPQALHLLADEISLPELEGMSRMNVLAGSLLLIYYEIVLGNSASNAWCHLQGAKILLEDQRDTQTPCFAFFRKVFQYSNVMLALSMGQRPLLICGDDCPKFTNRMDTVFGCTGRLWPLMHRLADIIGRIREGEDMTHEAVVLATSLEVWSIHSSRSADAYLEAMVQIAKAYKFCGLPVLLSISGESSTATERYWQIYQPAFDSVLRVCVLSTPMATLTWPLYVAGKLATSMSDCTAIMHIFEQFREKHHMMVVDGARNAVKAYWDRGSGEMDRQPSAPVLLG